MDTTDNTECQTLSSAPHEDPVDISIQDGAHIIVLGNEKGGSGKSTTAMHVAIALLRIGYKIATIDLDSRQGTLTGYMKRRWDFVTQTGQETPSPVHLAIEKSAANTTEDRHAEERGFLLMALEELRPQMDFIIIDTPGTDSYLSRLAHSYADTLITPMNDSFVDLSLLAELDARTHDIIKPSIYSDMVAEQKRIKAERAQKTGSTNTGIDWIVMRNRLSHIKAKNKRDIENVINALAGTVGFRVAPGFGERVIFKELYLKGLTLLDIREDKEIKMTLSNLSARQEVRQLILSIAPEKHKGHPRHKKLRT